VKEETIPTNDLDRLAFAPRRRGLMLARLGWVVVTLLTMGFIFASMPVRFAQLTQTVDQRPLLQLGISAAAYARYVISLDLLVTLASILIAGFIFFRRQDDWMALLVSLTLVTNGSILPLAQLFDAPGIPSAMLLVDNLVVYLGLVSSVVLIYLFPDGRFVPRGTVFLAVSWALLMFFAIFTPASSLSIAGWPFLLQLLVVVSWAGTGLYAQVFRYQKVSRPIQRQQTKWALLGLFAATIGPLLVLINIQARGVELAVPNIMYQRMGSTFFTTGFLLRTSGLTLFKLASLLFPLSFAIAVLRYRLWDIDLIIRRTLIYTVLSGLLIVFYLGGILVMQQILGTFTQSSQLAVVTSTLATAALINPLRRRVQDGIDRQFYRNRYDAEKILEAFSASLRDQVDLDELQDRLMVVVQETMQPEFVNILFVNVGPGHDESVDS
jgi:hypothetical protein